MAPGSSENSPPRVQIELNRGAAAVSYDPEKWGKMENDGDGMISLDRTAGAGSAVIIAERLGVPSSVAVDTVIEELRQKHPDLKVVSREMRTVNGHEVCSVKYGFRLKDLDMIVYAYCYGGLAGTLQVRTCCAVAAFDECERDFTELLASLQIRPSAHPRLARLSQGMGFAAKATLVCGPVLGFAFLRFFFRTDLRTGLLFTGVLTAGLFVFAWIYDSVKFKLK